MTEHVIMNPNDVPLCPKCGWPATIFMLGREITFECKQGHTFRYEDARSVGV